MYKGVHTIVTSHCRRGILQVKPFECSSFLHLYQWSTLYLYLPAPHSCCAHTPLPTNSLNLTSHSLCSLPPFVIASYHSCPHPISSTFPLLSHPTPLTLILSTWPKPVPFNRNLTWFPSHSAPMFTRYPSLHISIPLALSPSLIPSPFSPLVLVPSPFAPALHLIHLPVSFVFLSISGLSLVALGWLTVQPPP